MTRTRSTRLPMWRIGVAGGLVGMLCCTGPAVLALIGVLGAGTAFAWATDLYDGYAWWFRLAGLAVTATLVVVALRRRGACSRRAVRRLRWRLPAVAVIAIATYGLLYGVTSWLGTFAT